ncbi:MAG: hypothetical protein DRI86_07445 [Bacteroidetes bacterium]|nr:MAG: hypothetical protein DRI86_07445 [Bacteroidota bacterium]
MSRKITNPFTTLKKYIYVLEECKRMEWMAKNNMLTVKGQEKQRIEEVNFKRNQIMKLIDEMTDIEK